MRENVAYHNGYRALVPPPRPAPPPMVTPMPVPPPRVRLRNRRGTAVTLAALAAAFLVAAGVFAALFVAADADHAAATDRLADRRAELADLDERVEGTDAQRYGAERINDGLETENAELSSCVEAVRHYIWDADATNQAALDQMIALCQ